MIATLVNVQKFLHGYQYAWFCKDGFSFCCNAGAAFYSTPQRDNAGFYRKVEVSNPSKVEMPLRLYADDMKDLLGTTYRNVPLDVVVNIINSHGGLDDHQMGTEDK